MDKATVDLLIDSMIRSQNEVSDLIFVRGKSPLVESEGHLHEFAIDTPESVLTDEIIEAIADQILNNNERLARLYDTTGSCDTSYVAEGAGRFRVNIFKQNTGRAIVMRRFPPNIPTFEDLGLPDVFQQIVQERNGIILVTGAAGNGKTTTLAAMLNQINLTEAVHVVTLEDPIEFLHPSGRAAISQRELGRDFESFAHGLRVALRQSAKGILLGEIRDRETMEIALTAAETGHIVYSTLHTINAGQSINRILGFFGRDEEEQIRARLADTVRFIISQRLVGKIGGGRLLVTEVMGSSLRTRETIRYGESEGKTFHEIIEAAAPQGWHTLDHDLLRAFESQLINEETTLLHCTDKTRMRQHLDLQQKTRGDVSDAGARLSGLKMDRPRSAKFVVYPSRGPQQEKTTSAVADPA
jgi:twitching motility protein PilT